MNKNNDISLKIKVIVIAFVLLFVTAILFNWLINKDKTATLEVLVAPSDSKITIGEEIFSNGTYKIKPGEYQVKIEKESFNSFLGKITLKKDQTTKLYQAIFQTDGTNSWYRNHNSDDLILTAIGDRNTEISQDELIKKYPILKYIPYTAQQNGIKYKIDAQFTNNDLDYISIYFNSCSNSVYLIYKEEALSWLKNKDINIEEYKIRYSSLCSSNLTI